MNATLAYDELCQMRNIWLAAYGDTSHHCKNPGARTAQARLFELDRAANIRTRLDAMDIRLTELYATRTQELRLANLSPDTGEYTHDPRD